GRASQRHTPSLPVPDSGRRVHRARGLGIRSRPRARGPDTHLPRGFARRARRRAGRPPRSRCRGRTAALRAGVEAGGPAAPRPPPHAAPRRRAAARRDDPPQSRARGTAPRPTPGLTRRGRDHAARRPRPHHDADGCASVAQLAARGRASLLAEAAARFDLLQDLGDELARALVERPPAQASDGDAIRPGYDPELDELKDARDGGKQYIAGLQARERERTGIASLKVGFNKVFGYYLEITNPHRDRVPADYERRQTLSGAERFVTPELKAYEAKVLGAEERIGAREADLVDALRDRVAQAIARVQTTASAL